MKCYLISATGIMIAVAYQIVTRLLDGHEYSLSESELSTLVERTRGYSGSDMSYLCKARACLR